MIRLIEFFRRPVTILCIQLGAILLFLSNVLVWVGASGLPDTSSVDAVELTGADVAPLITAMALVALASGVAASIARPLGRGIIGAVLLGAGIIALSQAVLTLQNPAHMAASTLGEITGTTEMAGSYEVHFAVWIGLLGSVLVCIGALALLVASPSWPDRKTTKRYSRHKATTNEVEDPDAYDLWDGLSDGQDPTDTARDQPGPAGR